MLKLKIFPIMAACLLPACAVSTLTSCISEADSFHNFTKALTERRGSGWPVPTQVDALIGVYQYDLTAEEVQKIGLSSITDIADCQAVMEFYENGNGRIALYDERSKGPNPTSEAYDLEWYAEKMGLEDFSLDANQKYSDYYQVKIAFYEHFDIDYKGEYTFMQSARDSYYYERGYAHYDHAKDWFILINPDSSEAEGLSISSIKLDP